MEFYEVFSFLIILKESIKLLQKNGKFMASIAMLSLILPSILVLLFSYSYQSLMEDMTASYMKPSTPDSGSLHPLLYLALILAVEIIFLLAFVIIFHLSGVATILVSAMSYSGKNLSLQDLFSSIKRTWKRPLVTSFSASRQTTRYSLIAAVLTPLVIIYPNPITISIAISLGIIFLIWSLYSSVVGALSVVVSIVEDSCHGKDALERAAELVKGQRLHGFMLNLFFNLLVVIIFLVYWITSGEKGLLNLTILGLYWVNSISLAKMFIFMAYTVLYFQCKKHHGEETEIPGNFQYSKLPTTTLVSDIP